MKTRSLLLSPLLLLAVLVLPPASAAGEEGVPEGCVDKSYCDGTQCHPPESSISRLACVCGMLDPVCGVGRCVESSYCEGESCGESASCYPPDSPISQVMCGGAEVGPECQLPSDACGAGSCVEGSYCDSCGCQPQDSAASQALCGCELADVQGGLGQCVSGGYCDALSSESGSCYETDADVSRAICGGVTLVECKAPPTAEPVYCQDGSYCDATACHEPDTLISKVHCGFSSSSEDAAGQDGTTQRLTGTYDVGVIPRHPWGCPSGSEYIQIHMDDEDDKNKNYKWGWVGATQQNGDGTTFGFCRVDGEQFRTLARDSRVILPAQTYAVLKLGSSCPSATTIEFTRNFDNEDKNNHNWRQGNIWPNVSNSNTSLTFCMFMPSSFGGMSWFPSLGMEYGVFAAYDFASKYGLLGGYIHTDDEDRRNANSFIYQGQGGINTIIHSIISGVDNTDLRTVRVTSGPAPCSKLVYYHNGTSLSAWYDGANCYIKPIPSSGTAFIYANNYYVTAGPNNTCAEGVYDGANCYIMSAPTGTTAFKWGNAFYYAE